MSLNEPLMEFLMTYGWAILVVLVSIGALVYFGVFNPSRLICSCEDSPILLYNGSWLNDSPYVKVCKYAVYFNNTCDKTYKLYEANFIQYVSEDYGE